MNPNLSSTASMQWSGRHHVHELPYCIGVPPPDRRAIVIALVCKLFRAYRIFYVSLITIALEHQVGDATDVNFRDHQQLIGRTSIYS